MTDRLERLEQAASLSGLLGYLNFSDGRPDPRWQKQLNEAFAFCDRDGEAAPWLLLFDLLDAGLAKLAASGGAAFQDVSHARAALTLARSSLTAYRKHHADLLAHVAERDLFQPFFLARVCEAALACRAADSANANEAAVLARLNDFVGYRPIAILETRPRGEPYDHERFRPVPLYLRGVGVGWGPYRDILSRALEILADTDADLLNDAHLDLNLLDELALDVRAYDHGHPANRRPNYVFGEWDPHHLDNDGRFRRYVLRQITLEGLLERVRQPGAADPTELLTEGAAVLAGTILMATGVTGWGPAAHDSSTSLSVLLPKVARLRDAFYERLLTKLPKSHGARLAQEKATTRQPLGAARQHVNAWLGRQRAVQLQQRYLALLFAQMGFAEASREEAQQIAAVSVRFQSEILGRLTVGEREVERADLETAARRLPEVVDLLRRGIDCGALPDPWNILGFQGLFPLSSAREDSFRDVRLDELAHLVEQAFNLYSRLISEAAATGKPDLVKSLGKEMHDLAGWWDRFATTSVSEMRRVNGGESVSSANQVAKALARWHQRGEAAADIAFWRGHLDGFKTPRAFALVVETLLRKGDFRASLALLMSWLGQVEQVPLEEGVHSFPSLILRWMLALVGQADRAAADGNVLALGERRALLVKFFDFLEANAEDYWQVPGVNPLEETIEVLPDESEDLYEAAYEDVTYRDTTDDEEGAVAEGPRHAPFDLEEETPRLERHLRFLATLARLWQIAARFLAIVGREPGQPAATESPLPSWLATAQSMRERLTALLNEIEAVDVPPPSEEFDSLVEYDRRRFIRDQVLNAAITTCVDMTLAIGSLRGAAGPDGSAGADPQAPPWEPFGLRIEQALFTGEPQKARDALPRFIERFQKESLLATSPGEGSSPKQIVRVRVAQMVLRALLANLPRLGLVRETYELLRVARGMERKHPAHGKGITEFNHFFQAAFQASLEAVVESAAGWPAEQGGDQSLLDLLERITAPFLALWVDHSRTLQLSVLEAVTGGQTSETEWSALGDFVRRYGHDIFQARFMTLANLRGILHRGVGTYLDDLADHPDPLHPVRLIEELPRVGRDIAVRRLEIVLRAVVENYEEYKDYNTTTTQSDYGENLHVLLEFLRIKVAYDRRAWQFRPLVLAHEVLARLGRNTAAVRWQQQLAELTRGLAKQHVEQLTRLEQTHAVRLNTIRDRLEEAFLKPLALDRLCATIEPAMDEVRETGERPAFARLREELRSYTATPTGVGLDVPAWLRRLEAEVHRVQARHTTVVTLAEGFFRVPRVRVQYEDIWRQFAEWERPSLP